MGSPKRSDDPLEATKSIEERVSTSSLTGRPIRKYYGYFRGGWYGGSLAGYVIGCNLDCVFCWAWFKDRHELGRYQTPEEVVRRLTYGAIKAGIRVLRISGGEPTIGFCHLLEVLRGFSRGEGKLRLVVETNGILLGYSRTHASELGEFAGRNISVRVSLKGADHATFSRLTGAPQEYFGYQHASIVNLVKAGFEPGRDLYVAVMSSFNRPSEIAELLYRLSKIGEGVVGAVELEVVRLYKSVEKRLKLAGLHPHRSVKPRPRLKSL